MTYSTTFSGVGLSPLSGFDGWEIVYSDAASPTSSARISASGSGIDALSTGGLSVWMIYAPAPENRPSSGDHYAEVVGPSVSPGPFHGMVRSDGVSKNGFVFRLSSSQVSVWRSDGGTLTSLGAANVSGVTAADAIRLTAEGPALTLTRNGDPIWSYGAATQYQSNTIAAIPMRGTSNISGFMSGWENPTGSVPPVVIEPSDARAVPYVHAPDINATAPVSISNIFQDTLASSPVVSLSSHVYLGGASSGVAVSVPEVPLRAPVSVHSAAVSPAVSAPTMGGGAGVSPGNAAAVTYVSSPVVLPSGGVAPAGVVVQVYVSAPSVRIVAPVQPSSAAVAVNVDAPAVTPHGAIPPPERIHHVCERQLIYRAKCRGERIHTTAPRDRIHKARML